MTLTPMQLIAIAEALTDLYDQPTGEVSAIAAEQINPVCEICGAPIRQGMRVCSYSCRQTLAGRSGRGAAKAHPVYGEQNGAAVLTDRRVRRIRAMRDEGWRAWEIASELGVSVSAISGVLSGRTWGHVGRGGR